MAKQQPEYRPLRDWHPKKGDDFLTPWGETVHVIRFNTYKYGKGWYVTLYEIRFIGPKGYEVELETEGLAKVRKKR